jgi:hypothetical protein
MRCGDLLKSSKHDNNAQMPVDALGRCLSRLENRAQDRAWIPKAQDRYVSYTFKSFGQVVTVRAQVLQRPYPHC